MLMLYGSLNMKFSDLLIMLKISDKSGIVGSGLVYSRTNPKTRFLTGKIILKLILTPYIIKTNNE